MNDDVKSRKTEDSNQREEKSVYAPAIPVGFLFIVWLVWKFTSAFIKIWRDRELLKCSVAQPASEGGGGDIISQFYYRTDILPRGMAPWHQRQHLDFDFSCTSNEPEKDQESTHSVS